MWRPASWMRIMPARNYSPNEELVYVDAPHFCAALFHVNGKIIDAAPILRWAIGKQLDWFLAYCKRKGWKYEQPTVQHEADAAPGQHDE